MNFADYLVQAPKNHLKFEDMLYMEEMEDDYEEVEEEEYDEQGYNNGHQQNNDEDLDTIYEQDEENSQATNKQISISCQSQEDDVTTYLLGDIADAPIIILEERKLKKKAEIQLKTFREQTIDREKNKKQAELRFQHLLTEQASYLLKEQKEQQIKQKLFKSVKHIEPAIKQMLEVSYINIIPKPKIQSEQKDYQKKIDQLDQKVENLKQEITQLKIQHNQDEEIIKTLKIQITRMNDCNTTLNSSFMSKGSNKQKGDYLKEENEKLQQEIVYFKKTLLEERESFRTKMSRANKITSTVQNKKTEKEGNKQIQSINDPHPILTQENFTKMSLNLTELRLNIQKLNDKLAENEQIIKNKDKEILNLLNKLEGKSLQLYMREISDLKAIVEQKNEEIEFTKQQMMIDVQINSLFPTQGNIILKYMNLMMMIEGTSKKKKYNIFFKYIISKVYIVQKKLKQFLQYGRDYIKYLFHKKNPIEHPSNQEVIRIAIKHIRASPNILEKVINKQYSQIQELKVFILLQIYYKDNIHILQVQNDKLQQNEKNKTQRYKQIEDLHRVDKMELASNFMMRILKKEAEEGIQLNPEIDIVKVIIYFNKLNQKYIDLIYKDLRETSQDLNLIKNARSPKKIEPEQTIVKKFAPLKETCCSKQNRHERRKQMPTILEKKVEQQKNK